ncbi:COG4223 family protein [Histidinibacterium aquaticum]|uniref:Mitochondrial inner membrane protein n=1 Tax=Histidinibacterium aquaticum TaxID=2613962 RepID=A0A5J5GFF9_9RHOB|nr:mitofilin family membrane protein [Histidinibacterium aquaticum]KAA9006750.1 hypothetical protein F3S47_13295 [Histidinibacterium aquaticum]
MAQDDKRTSTDQGAESVPPEYADMTPLPRSGRDVPVSEEAPEAPGAAEPETPSRPEPPADPVPIPDQSTGPVPEARARRSSGFVPLFLGGVVAAALGFGASWYLGQQNGTLDLASELGARDETITGLDQRLSEIEAQTEALAEGPDLTPLQQELEAATSASADTSARIDALQTELGDTLASFGDRLDQLDDRLTNVEQRPEADGSLSEEAVAAYEREIAALREETAQAVEGLNARAAEIEERFAGLTEEVSTRLEEIRSEAEAIEEDTEAAAARAAAAAALSDIRAAIENGAPFTEALTALQATGAVETPEALAANAEEGVPSLAALRDRFPDAARSALAQARADEEGGGMGAFFTRQLNVRSVEPREGDSADAVLSRAGAAVEQGRLADALAELQDLPDDAQEPLTDWISAAETRIAARDAVETLTQDVTSN